MEKVEFACALIYIWSVHFSHSSWIAVPKCRFFGLCPTCVLYVHFLVYFYDICILKAHPHIDTHLEGVIIFCIDIPWKQLLTLQSQNIYKLMSVFYFSRYSGKKHSIHRMKPVIMGPNLRRLNHYPSSPQARINYVIHEACKFLGLVYFP